MSDQTPPSPQRSVVSVDLTNAEVIDTHDEQSDESVLILRLHVLRTDGVEFQKKARWDLFVGREDLAHIARKILAALDQE